MFVKPVAHVRAESVEWLLFAAQSAVSPSSMAMFLGGPMQEALKTRAQERFLGQGEDISGSGWKPWEPLKQSTIDIREAQGFGPLPINRRTGQLEAYITQSNAAVSPTATGAAMVYPGSPPGDKWLAKKVETASVGKPATKSRVATPPRPVLGLSTNDLEIALVRLAGWITAAISSGGKR